MLYQRRIADNQIVSAKLELHLRGSRYAGVGAQLLGIVSLGLAGFYSLNGQVMLAWAISLLVLNLWWSRRINRTLETSRHFTNALRCLMSFCFMRLSRARFGAGL